MPDIELFKYILEFLLELFSFIGVTISEIPPIAIFPIVIIVLIIIIEKYKKSSELKKHLLSGSVIFAGITLFFTIIPIICWLNDIYIYSNTLWFIDIYLSVITICIVSGITLMTAYIILSIYEKATLKRKKELNTIE